MRSKKQVVALALLAGWLLGTLTSTWMLNARMTYDRQLLENLALAYGTAVLQPDGTVRQLTVAEVCQSPLPELLEDAQSELSD